MSQPDWSQIPAECFYNAATNASCTISMPMIDYLNLTDLSLYHDAFCANPPSGVCPFGYCPNPDIAGLFIRLSSKSLDNWGLTCLLIDLGCQSISMLSAYLLSSSTPPLIYSAPFIPNFYKFTPLLSLP
jgi:hypothetical protein